MLKYNIYSLSVESVSDQTHFYALNDGNVNIVNSFKATKSCVTCGSINMTTSIKLSDVIFCLRSGNTLDLHDTKMTILRHSTLIGILINHVPHVHHLLCASSICIGRKRRALHVMCTELVSFFLLIFLIKSIYLPLVNSETRKINLM